MRAAISQSCIVTLEPVASRIDEQITAVLRAGRLAPSCVPIWTRAAKSCSTPKGQTAAEPFTGNEIDVGALVEEFFALGIDPYPRKAGATLGDILCRRRRVARSLA